MDDSFDFGTKRVKTEGELEVTGVSRSGRVRKKSSKLTDFESLDEIDMRTPKSKKEKQDFSTPISRSIKKEKITIKEEVLSDEDEADAGGFTVKPEQIFLKEEPLSDMESENDFLYPPNEDSSLDSLGSDIDDIDDPDLERDDPEGFQPIVGDSADDTPSQSQSVYMMEKSNKKKLVIKDGKIVGRIKAQRKDKGKTRFTAYMLWAKEIRSELTKHNPDLDFSQTSKKLGELWATVPYQEKYIPSKRSFEESGPSSRGDEPKRLKYWTEEEIHRAVDNLLLDDPLSDEDPFAGSDDSEEDSLYRSIPVDSEEESSGDEDSQSQGTVFPSSIVPGPLAPAFVPLSEQSSSIQESDPNPAPIMGPTPCPPMQWSDEKPSVRPMPFTGISGLKVQPDGNSPFDYFRLLANEEFIDLVVSRTNRYAQRILGTSTARHARIKYWKDLTGDVFLKFLGLLFFMGQAQLPSVTDYWRQSFPYNFPTWPLMMSRDRFLLILRCLHFSEGPQGAGADPLYKIQPLLDFFNTIMEKVYYPKKELSIDEPMMLWRGRLYFRQYIANKKHKYGVKLYTLTQPNGLVLRTLVYSGTKDTEVGGKGHAAKVVRYLMDKKLGVGHAIYADSFYTSVPLAHELLDNKTYLTGTLHMLRKGNPTEVMKAKLKKGEVIERFTKKGVSVFKWLDKRDVIIISSEFDGQLKTVKKKGRTFEKPNAIVQYTRYMGGIDTSDQLMAYYPFERKALRWYAKLGIHIFHLMITNSYRLFQQSTGSRMGLLQFRDAVIFDLLGGNPPKPEQPLQLISPVNHFPQEVPTKQRKRCRVCRKKEKKLVKAKFICPDCPDRPGLCLHCFKIYHSELVEQKATSCTG